jgi:hypothetical protein
MPYFEVDEDGEVLTPVRLGRLAARAAYEAEAALRDEQPGAEATGRSALTTMVDAFLADRRVNQKMFRRAHRLGRELMETFGCWYQYDEARSTYVLGCPVPRLHAQVATSIAWTLKTVCSVCGAQPFSCDHMIGEEYDGVECYYESEGIERIDHIALTTNPDFAYTWMISMDVSAKEALTQGDIDQPGGLLACTHCAACYGTAGPKPEDEDPSITMNEAQTELGSGGTE